MATHGFVRVVFTQPHITIATLILSVFTSIITIAKLILSMLFKDLLAKGAFQLVEEEEEEEAAGGESGYESDDEGGVDFDEDELVEEEEEDELEEEGSGRPKNDPEWQFFDTAKVFVKAGDGGE
jgi:hypothetical protein